MVVIIEQCYFCSELVTSYGWNIDIVMTNIGVPFIDTSSLDVEFINPTTMNNQCIAIIATYIVILFIKNICIVQQCVKLVDNTVNL